MEFVSVDVFPLMLMGLPGAPNCECLSFSDLIERRDSSLRTVDGRLRGGDCAGDSSLGFEFPIAAFSLSEVPDGEEGNAPGIRSGVVGCEDNGPRPGVGGRGVAGGESNGAGMLVPSVREKDSGVMVRGLNVGGAISGWSNALNGLEWVGELEFEFEVNVKVDVDVEVASRCFLSTRDVESM
jgi:hypothetical protein